MTDTEPTEQPRRHSNCPQCGEPATDDSVTETRLSALGYLHNDQKFVCAACGASYWHGVPVGEPDFPADDLWCDVCDLGYMRAHRTEGWPEGIRLHLKCDHHHAFTCPHCDTEIPADGLRPERTGAVTCPHCASAVDRADAPYCFYFRMTGRQADGTGICLIGNPVITGNTEHAEEAYGYPEDGPAPRADTPAETDDD